jgi:thiosulfate/3-mercaptopyruvate sulfurtransferase
MSRYAHPEALVDTRWAAEHLDDPAVRFVEVDVDTTAYDKGHVPGAVGWNWQTDLNDRVRRDLISPEAFAELNRAAGIRPDDTVVFYGDNNNWFAAWALWQFKYYGHRDVRLLNGGRKKWELEGRPLDTGPARRAARSDYPVPTPDESVRAYRRDVEEVVARRTANLVDVRSPDEFSGKINAPPGLAETAQRSGHIPGARNIPWAKAANDDGTFRSAAELAALYGGAGVDGIRPTVTYCRIGERSSHSWFVLKYLLGLPDVRNYDGSWTEWGNGIGAPIELEVTPVTLGEPCVAG